MRQESEGENVISGQIVVVLAIREEFDDGYLRKERFRRVGREDARCCMYLNLVLVLPKLD